jgi:predicted RNA binding protein YcfA (HicA-like mRNA interferase family)
MKRNEFIRWLMQNGCLLYRHGGRHDIYLNPARSNLCQDILKLTVTW